MTASLLVDKELLRPGVVYYPRTGPVSFSDDQVEDILRESHRLLSSGRDVPVPAEHQDGALPLSKNDALGRRLADETLHNTGWVRRYYRQPDGSLWATLEIKKPDAIAAISDDCVRHASPEIMPVFPADGTVYRNVITHVALTNKPVWKEQRPFLLPDSWLGDDGAVLVRPARLSLCESAAPLRLSLADAQPPPEVLEAIQLGYRIPKGRDGQTGVWVRGRYHESHVPKAVLSGLDDDEKRDLLRKLSLRHARKIPQDLGALSSQAPPREYDSEVQDVPAAHLSLHDALPPFAHQHPPGHPLLVWEDPADGRTHVVSGHDAHKQALAQEGARLPVYKVHAAGPYEARGAALMAHVLSGHAHEDDLAQLLMDGAPHGEIQKELQGVGHTPDPQLWGRAQELADLPKVHLSVPGPGDGPSSASPAPRGAGEAEDGPFFCAPRWVRPRGASLSALAAKPLRRPRPAGRVCGRAQGSPGQLRGLPGPRLRAPGAPDPYGLARAHRE